MKKKNLERSVFSRNLIRLRKEKGITQTELAEICGISKRMIGFYETKAINPPGKKLKILADTLGISINDLLVEENSKENKIPKELEDIITEIDTKTLKKMVLIKNLPPKDRTDLYKYLDKLVKLNAINKTDHE